MVEAEEQEKKRRIETAEAGESRRARERRFKGKKEELVDEKGTRVE